MDNYEKEVSYGGVVAFIGRLSFSCYKNGLI